MRYALVDNRMTADLKSAVRKYADDVLLLPTYPKLPIPVASHPDMLVWIYEKNVVTFKSYREIAENVFDRIEDAGYKIILSDREPSELYPYDVPLNCAVAGKRIICNRNYVAAQIRELADKEGLEIIHTRQGYAKCSAVTVSENAVITADPSISQAAMSCGIDVLKITENAVALNGYDTGFIGGSSGTLLDKVLFCGNLDAHPDSEKIISFCKKHGKTAVSLSTSPLYDYGTVFFL